jgi:hypothetical protein
MQFAEREVSMGEKRNAYRVLVRKRKVKPTWKISSKITAYNLN